MEQKAIYNWVIAELIREEKLLFTAMCPRLPVIANQSADWCGNPPDEWNQVTITTKNRSVSQSYRVIVDTFYL